jgi:hypothetical protein
MKDWVLMLLAGIDTLTSGSKVFLEPTLVVME